MLTLAIQAGGKSSRMGQDKALLPFRGAPLIRHVIGRLAPLADEILVTTNNPQNYRFLGVRLVRDLRPGRGALGGLYTALSAATGDFVAAAACDMPFASLSFFETANRLIVESEADVVVPQSDHGYEPLHALYRRESCLPAVEAALDADLWKVIAWFPQVNVRALTPQETAAFNPDGLTFWNINTPEDFEKAATLS